MSGNKAGWGRVAIGSGIAATALAVQLFLSLQGPSAFRPVVPLSLDDFQLPPKSVFDGAMPRYPNVWFYVDSSIASSHESAVKLVTERLKKAMRLREFFPPFDNPEGCDFEARLEHLQPWHDRSAPALQHAHAFHMRYYYSALARQKSSEIVLPLSSEKRKFYRFAASVHYEVEHHNPNHADVEACPICGRTGAYSKQEGNLVERVHDPLGLELLMNGTVRSETVRFEDQGQEAVGSIAGIRDFNAQQYTFDAGTADRNTLRIGIVVFSASRP